MSGTPVIVFGAFDRHNFGDLLFAHVAEALLPGRELLFGGVARRDLRPFGGHAVDAIAGIAAEWGDRPVHLLHAGGEILTVDVWQAAMMVLPADDVAGIVGLYRDDRRAGITWARDYLGLQHLAAYVVPRSLFRNPGRWLFGGVGGAALADCAAPQRAEVEAVLRGADFVGVRDDRTLAALRTAGVQAQAMPDPGVMVGELFGDRIRRHGEGGEPAALRQALPQGYLAVQFSAEFGDDATLAAIAEQLDCAASKTRLGVALFRAGAAPWHDDMNVLRRAAGRMRMPARVFESPNVWDICALIAGSRGYCGSSLHGRILALDYGLPRVSLVAGSANPGKLEAFVDTWDSGNPDSIATLERLSTDLLAALEAGADAQRRAAVQLARLYRERFAELTAMLYA